MTPAKREKTAATLRLHPTTARGTRKPAQIYELEISLLEIEPRIWRRFVVRNSISLAKLHDVIQIVMGWHDCHLHRFVTPDETRYAPRSPDMDLEWDADVIESRRVKLHDVMPKRGSRLVYEYDFGDGWRHELKVFDIHNAKRGENYPTCVSGQRACPPEDVGGPWGYAELLEAIADPKHEEHDSYLNWLGHPFNPEAFDAEEVNEVLESFR